MPNRRRLRKIMMPPPMEGYKPFGVPMRNIGPAFLLFEEFEAIRLADYENLTQAEAAEKMDISRPTFTRLYDKARKSIAKAFVEGKAVLIQGGSYITEDYWYRCRNCHETMVSIKPARNCRSCESVDITRLNEKPDD